MHALYLDSEIESNENENHKNRNSLKNQTWFEITLIIQASSGPLALYFYWIFFYIFQFGIIWRRKLIECRFFFFSGCWHCALAQHMCAVSEVYLYIIFELFTHHEFSAAAAAQTCCNLPTAVQWMNCLRLSQHFSAKSCQTLCRQVKRVHQQTVRYHFNHHCDGAINRTHTHKNTHTRSEVITQTWSHLMQA